MLRKEYYCLVAGLPDLFFNENKPGTNSIAFKTELHLHLTDSDLELLNLLFFRFDNVNLLNLYFNLGNPFLPLGNISKNEFQKQLAPENESPELPAYMLQFINWMKDRESKELNTEVENILHALFYEFALSSKNRFLLDWFSFEINIKNITTAFNCRNFGYDLQQHLIKVKNNSLIYPFLLNKHLKPDLLENILPFCDAILKTVESKAGILEKEKAIDNIKWDYLDENTFFHYFTIEKVLSYMIKLLITERWLTLEPQTGKAMLQRITEELKTGYEFPEEFNLMK